jgi:hypothetical protein
MVKEGSFKSFGDAFKNFKPKAEAKEIPVPVPSDVPRRADSTTEMPTPKAAEIDEVTGLEKEDNALFARIAKALKYEAESKGPHARNGYWRVRDIVRDSHKHDVAFNVSRWMNINLSYGKWSPDELANLKKDMSTVLRRGYVAESKSWEKSIHEPRYGTATPEYKRKEAERFAKLAEAPFEELAHRLRLYI